MQSILVTGSSGRLGGKFIKLLLETTEYNVIAAASSEEKMASMQVREKIKDSERISFMSNKYLVSADTLLPDLYGAVHLAFSRRNQPANRIADSIGFSAKVFEKLAVTNVEKVINVSSQGVYGATEEIRTENTPAAPDNLYTMAKYATEVIFNSVFGRSKRTAYTNLRLDIVAQSNNLIQVLCKQAKEGTIHLRGGEQVFSYIDEDDAVSAILAMLVSSEPWEKEYNVGWNCLRLKLTEVADIVAKSVEKCGYGKPVICLDKQEIHLWAGIETDKFSNQVAWRPTIQLEESIINLLKTVH